MLSNYKIIYGFHAIKSRLQYYTSSIKEIFFDPTRHDYRIKHFLHIAQIANIRLSSSNANKLHKLCGNMNHQGIVAQVTEIELYKNIETLLKSLKESPLLLVLDSITDPHNLGACLRVADAAGAHALIAPKNRAVKLNATAAKVASGAADVIPYITVTNLTHTLRDLKSFGICIIGTDFKATNNLYKTNLTGPISLVMGSENKGMRRLTRETCDTILHIPMNGIVESINVSVASGICLFEIMRQRSNMI